MSAVIFDLLVKLARHAVEHVQQPVAGDQLPCARRVEAVNTYTYLMPLHDDYDDGQVAAKRPGAEYFWEQRVRRLGYEPADNPTCTLMEPAIVDGRPVDCGQGRWSRAWRVEGPVRKLP